MSSPSGPSSASGPSGRFGPSGPPVDEGPSGPVARPAAAPDAGSPPPARAPFAALPVGAVAAALLALELGFSGRYGYHRDELYFLVAGQHLAWGYPDQPPLVPAVARAMSAAFPHSLVALRAPMASAVAAVVVMTGLLAREFGARRGGQTLAAGGTAVSAIVLALGHTLSTATFALLAEVLLLWMLVRLLRSGDGRWWPLIGVLAGIGLMADPLVGAILLGAGVGILVSGPRRVLWSPWPALGAAVAAGLWLPYLLWQARHGWPELAVSRSIAAGGSGTSLPRGLFPPMQAVVVSAFLTPVWIAGLVRLLRARELRVFRSLGWAYLVLVVLFTALAGKTYYLVALYPVLLAAGAQPTLDWVRRRPERAGRRRALLAAAVLLSLVDVVVSLPVVPAAMLHATPITALDEPAGETVGWPVYVRQVAAVYRALPVAERSGAIVLTRNYGEAGAVDYFGPALGLPPAYSGHNGFYDWGPPPDSARTAVVIGFQHQPGLLRGAFGDCRQVARLENGLHLDNDEQHTPLWICTGRRASWPALWPGFKTLG
ncbi:ArnT family glycosyltransferase [Phaeacidiphilus oryzae]|uniref:ArnT family glycosyltransferase n=1 Tax=Phaeacidiphilus oryzae TaxID=348818 RepID=UPI000A028E68|nr:glycosyltransferase family 39 protein [Phaeacidiphilus oryzae]